MMANFVFQYKKPILFELNERTTDYNRSTTLMTSKIKGLNRVIRYEGFKSTSFSNIIDFTIIRAGDGVPTT